MRATALALCLSVIAGTACAETAPKPLYRDPVHDGAADASIMYDKGARPGACSTPTAAPT